VPLDVVNTTESQANSLLAALESMVLLHNVNDVLPFAKGLHVAVIGPHANAQSAIVGNVVRRACGFAYH
jgi:hypothetical protein